MSGLVIKPRARIFHGHDWVYASDVQRILGEPQDGEVITLKDVRARPLGSAIFNKRSQIVARRFSRQRQDLDLDFFRRRITLASDYRDLRGVDPRLRRVVWSESDGLPGLILDRYGDCVVLQTLTLGMDLRKSIIVQAIQETLSPTSIIERNDAPIRKAEGLESVVGVLFGPEPAPISASVNGVEFVINPLHGQKTGFYLDQASSYADIAAWANGRRVLDCFANQGAFGLCCAKAGATEVTCVEAATDLVTAIAANAQRNDLRVKAVEANVFDFLKAAEEAGSQYDLIVLDPPSFTRNREKVHDALRGYKEIHLRAMKLLTAEGLLATFSCSHHIDAATFEQMTVDAAVDAKRSFRLLKRLGQAPDHPALPHLPETEYLKGLLLEAMPGR